MKLDTLTFVSDYAGCSYVKCYDSPYAIFGGEICKYRVICDGDRPSLVLVSACDNAVGTSEQGLLGAKEGQ